MEEDLRKDLVDLTSLTTRTGVGRDDRRVMSRTLYYRYIDQRLRLESSYIHRLFIEKEGDEEKCT